MFERGKDGSLDELVEVMFVDFPFLEVGDKVAMQSENELSLGVLPDDSLTFVKLRTIQTVVKVLYSVASIRNGSVLFTVDLPDCFCVGVGEAEDAGSKVAGEAEFSDQDEHLKSHGVIDEDLRLARGSYLPR